MIIIIGKLYIDFKYKKLIQLIEIFLSINLYININISVNKMTEITKQVKTIFQQLIYDNPRYLWNKKELAKNSNLSIDFLLEVVLDKKEMDEYLCFLCLNKNFDIKFMNMFSYKTKNVLVNMSENESITLDMISQNKCLKWSYLKISQRKNITVNDIIKYPDIPWRWNVLVFNQKIPFEYILEHSGLALTELPFCSENDELYLYDELSPTPYNLSLEKILKYKHLPWNWSVITTLPFVNMQTITDNPTLPWNKELLSYNQNISLNDIKYYPEINWDYDILSENEHLTISFILENLDKKWNWEILSMNKKIGISIILAHPSLPWNYKSVSRRLDLTPEIIINNPNINWDYGILSGNPIIDIAFVLATPDKKWDFDMISYNPGILPKDIRDFSLLPWNYRYVSENEFCYSYYYITPEYKQKLVKKFLMVCSEELLIKTFRYTKDLLF